MTLPNHVKVEAAPLDHPEGPVALWVKDNYVFLTNDEARAVAEALKEQSGLPAEPIVPDPTETPSAPAA